MKVSSSECSLTGTAWHKSTYSGGDGGDCLETSDGHPGLVPVRDSKLGDGGPVLAFRTEAWAAFVGDLKAG
ncbi:DUF397 domain-containing protein [Streptomyces sp. NBC_00102]|uniref:DUF397 domain-containing protein n=1 Tax=Streptomyces sp. NBC_00102 TaxID=2975652 RepID=UPI00224D3724|nr:DUF397 domain-containing protein [Streptomyces sp. NBC_00102]MCX5397843.1 DUF397 domain-containing protein [Streptomyces sp. NBC_00102]